MQPATPTAPETPRDSATVVLLRDAPAGMEVLLLRRHAQASNMAGVYVFPGGKLDEADRTLGHAEWLDQPATCPAHPPGRTRPAPCCATVCALPTC